MTSNILKYRTNYSREWSWSHWSQLQHSLWHCRMVSLLRNSKEMRYFKEKGLKWTSAVGLFCKNTLEPLLSSQKVHWKERNEKMLLMEPGKTWSSQQISLQSNYNIQIKEEKKLWNIMKAFFLLKKSTWRCPDLRELPSQHYSGEKM